MNLSRSMLSTAVLAAMLGSASLAVQAQSAGTFGSPGAADAPPTSTHQPEMQNAPGSPQEGPGALAPDSQSRDAQGMGSQGSDAAGSASGSGMGAGSQGSDAAGTFGSPGGSGSAPPTSTHQPEMLNAPGSPQEGPGALAPDSQSRDAQGMGAQGSGGASGMGSDAAGSAGGTGMGSGMGSGSQGSDAAGTFGSPGGANTPPPTSTHQPEMLNAPGSPQEGPGALAPDAQSRDAQGMGTQGSGGASGMGSDAAGSTGGAGMGSGSQGSDAGGTFGTPGGADAPPLTSTHQPEMLNAPGSPQEGPGALAPGAQGSGADAAGTMGGGTAGYGTGGSDRAGAMGAGGGSGMGAAGGSSLGASGMGSDAAARGGAMGGAGQSWLPYTSHGYVGASLGRADFDDACPTCDNPDWSGKVFTGGMLNEWSGVEASWIWFGRADNVGGKVRAHGLNLSYVLNIPVTQGANLFGKLGGTYGWTRTTGGAPGAVTGNDNGFGLSYGLGGSMDVAPNWAVMLEWERHRLKFAAGRNDADLLTLGVKYKF